MRYYLGLDGGQSHTTALVADETGRIIGRGAGGPSNHTRAPGGRERLKSAVCDSVGEALERAGIPTGAGISEFPFFSAHLALTGEPEDKVAIIRDLVSAIHLGVGHDAPAALAGALGGRDGVIVLAGTGSVAYGTIAGRAARIGGVGYVFGDEGSGFDIARRAVVRALRAGDRGKNEPGLERALLDHFGRDRLKSIVEDFYAETISREGLASFAARAAGLADAGEEWAVAILGEAARHLAEMARAAATRLEPQGTLFVTYGGGVFRSRLILERFRFLVEETISDALVVAPRFGPDIGALILAFQAEGALVPENILAAMGDNSGGEA